MSKCSFKAMDEHASNDAGALAQAHAALAGDTSDPSLYINREASWLEFNDRVLQLAEDERLPLLERVKFCAIYTTNLDEYYMVRVAGLHDQIDAGASIGPPRRSIPSQTIALIRERALEQGRAPDRLLEGQLRPQLAEHGIRIAAVDEPDEDQRGDSTPLPAGDLPALTPPLRSRPAGRSCISNLSAEPRWRLVRDPVGAADGVRAREGPDRDPRPRFVALWAP
jgi:polyphosphate kinase